MITALSRVCALMALALFTPFAFAGQKTVFGTTAQPIEQYNLLSNSGPNTQDAAYPAISYSIPRFDGRDENGVFIGYDRLIEARLTVALTIESRQHGENRASTPLGLWRSDAGVTVYFGSSPFLESEPPTPVFWGGEEYAAHSAHGLSLGAFDGTVDGAGSSGYDVTGGSSPWLTGRKLVGTNDARELRRWCGASGSTTAVYCMPRAKRSDTGWAGHWDRWDSLSVTPRDIAWIPGAQILVTYVWADGPPPANVVERAWEMPWQELPSYFVENGAFDAPAFLSSLPAFPGDPSKLRRVVLEYASEATLSQGIENVGTQQAICGGNCWVAFGVRLPGASASLMGSSASQSMGSGNVEMQAFDGVQDFAGTSGFEFWSSPSYTQVWRRDSAEPWSWTGPPVSWFANPIPFEMVTNGAAFDPEAVTPGGEFAWWGNGRITSRFRVVFFVAP